MSTSFTEQGSFTTGCNYWASHAGTFMWSDWKPKIVEADLKQLSESGLQVLRVFPLWSDFQPLTNLKTLKGVPVEYRMGESPLPDTEAGQAGVSEEMMQRFKFFADTADKYNLKLVVGLLTGWMSGRLFVPQAFENLNALTTPSVIIWETRFVKYFVKYFKNHPAILAWNLGNECNCMGKTNSRDEAWIWASQITNAIKVVDNSRPVVSGMHAMKLTATNGNWTIQDLAEITDVLTTHPYPAFTPYCNQDPINEIRNGLHATAESCMYADVGNRPCIVEEIGTLGPMICSEQVAADYMRTVMFSSWAHDLRSILWWCAYDQDHLVHAPYDWYTNERFLGLFRNNREPKPVLLEFEKFRKFLDKAPKLPPRTREAVCILSEGQDHWGTAYSSFIMAKQTGLDIDFQYVSQPLKKSSLYLVPSAAQFAFPRRKWLELLEIINNGATLYISYGEEMPVPFEKPFGLEVQTKEIRTANVEFDISGKKFLLPAKTKMNIKATTAKIIGRENDGNPIFTVNKYGNGDIYVMGLPVEQALSGITGAFHKADSLPWHSLYKIFAEKFTNTRAATKNNPQVGITEHQENDKSRYVVLINYGSKKAAPGLVIKAGLTISSVISGWKNIDSKGFEIPGNSAVVLHLKKRGIAQINKGSTIAE